MKAKPPPRMPCRNLLLYGPPKSGKTAAACGAPGPGLLNADLPNATWFAHQRHPLLVEYEWGPSVFQTMIQLAQEANRGELDEGTVIVDPIGELYRKLLNELSQNAVAPSLPLYLATQTHIERFCRSLCECQHVNAIIVAHEHPVKDESTGQVERLPYTGTTNPALGQKLMGMVDVVGYTNVIEPEGGDPEFWAQLINGRGRRGGDRFNVLGRFRKLDLAEWFELMSSVQSDSDATSQKESHVNALNA